MSDSRFSSLIAHCRLLMAEERWSDALQAILQAEAIARKDYGVEDKCLGAALELKAVICRNLGHTLDAEQAMQEATRIALLHLRRRGKSFGEQQKHAEAETDYREALRICELGYGNDHAETATCLDNLATCLRLQSRFVEALSYCKRGLDIRLAIHGEEHGHSATSLANLGHLHRILGQYLHAEPLLVKSLVIRKKLYGANHPLVAESLDRLGSLRRDQGKFDEAIQYGEDAVKIRKQSLGANHPLTGAAIHNLALSRERRPSDAATSADGRSEAIATDLQAPATIPDLRSGNAGLWLLGFTAVCMCSAVGVVFLYFPHVIRTAVFIAAIILSMLGLAGLLELTGIVSIDRFIIRLVARARQRREDVGRVDRDSLVFGQKPSVGVPEIVAPNGKGLLNADQARQLVALRTDPLDLWFVHSVTQAAADELAKHKGTLKLNNLREVRSKLAKSLRWHEGRLELNGVPELTDAAAAHLARHPGDLALSGMRELRKSVAQHLAHHRGTLELNGVRSINEQAAEWVVKHRGIVRLHECRVTSPATQRILRTNVQIEFPDPNADDMMTA